MIHSTDTSPLWSLPARLVAVLCLAGSLSAQAGSWQLDSSSDGSKPTGRHEAAYVEIDGLFYLLGGRGDRPVDVYDPVADTWTDLGEPPLRMHHFQPVAHDGKIWALCAFEGNYPNETAVDDVWIYDPALNSWTTGPTIPSARNRGSAGAVVHDGMIYVVGGNTQGHDGGYVPWFDRFDPDSGTWTTLPDAPHARDHFMAAVVGQKLIVAGGRQTEQPDPQENTIGAVDVYDFSTGTWTNMPEALPTERAGTMTVSVGEHVLVVGGESPSGAHDETEALDVHTGEWLILPDLLDSRHSGGLVAHDGALYAVSGNGKAGGGNELTTQERLDLTGWLPTSPGQLLDNGDFDDGLSGWTDLGDLSLHGTGNIAAPSLDVENGAAEQLLAADALETYTLTGVHRRLGSSGAATIALQFLDSGSNLLDEVERTVSGSASWASFALTGTTPVGTTSLRLRLAATGNRTLRVDDLVLVEHRDQIVQLGVPANPLALAPSALPPALGRAFSLAIDHTGFAPDATLDALLLGFRPDNAPTALGTLLVDFSTVLYRAPGAPFQLQIPVNPSLVGLTVWIQGGSVAPSGDRLTNALEVTIQS